MTPKETKLISWVERTGYVLRSQVSGSGLDRALGSLVRAKQLRLCAHPTVKDSMGYPADAVSLPAPLEAP